jgi:hypothetical protein
MLGFLKQQIINFINNRKKYIIQKDFHAPNLSSVRRLHLPLNRETWVI